MVKNGYNLVSLVLTLNSVTNMQIGGSYTLNHYGLLGRPPKDLDIVVADLEVFKKDLEPIYDFPNLPDEANMEYPEDSDNPKRLKLRINGIRLDVFESPETMVNPTRVVYKKTVLWLQPASVIIEAKERYATYVNISSHVKHVKDITEIKKNLLISLENNI